MLSKSYEILKWNEIDVCFHVRAKPYVLTSIKWGGRADILGKLRCLTKVCLGALPCLIVSVNWINILAIPFSRSLIQTFKYLAWHPGDLYLSYVLINIWPVNIQSGDGIPLEGFREPWPFFLINKSEFVMVVFKILVLCRKSTVRMAVLCPLHNTGETDQDSKSYFI